jgi:hypothetical protein
VSRRKGKEKKNTSGVTKREGKYQERKEQENA